MLFIYSSADCNRLYPTASWFQDKQFKELVKHLVIWEVNICLPPGGSVVFICIIMYKLFYCKYGLFHIIFMCLCCYFLLVTGSLSLCRYTCQSVPNVQSWCTYLLVYLWLQRVLIHWGSVSCRLGSITFRLTGSWCTSQLGFLRKIHQKQDTFSWSKHKSTTLTRQYTPESYH